MVHHFYDETSSHPIIVAAMAERRPFWRSALYGAYGELVSVQGKQAYAASLVGKPVSHVDRIVTVGDVANIEPFATDCMVAGLVRRKYMRYVGDERFQLVQHAKLTHSRTAMQMWWERVKKKDTDDPVMKAAVRWRDGDQCRCCHNLLNWAKGNDTDPFGGTLDHRTPGQPAESPDDLAAVCRRCNGIRSDSPNANDVAPWQPVPDQPFYTKGTVTFLRKALYTTDPKGNYLHPTGKQYFLTTITILPRPAIPADTALSDLEPIEVPLPPQWAWEAHDGHDGHICGSRPHTQWDTAPTGHTDALKALKNAPSDPAIGGIPQVQEPPENVDETSAVPGGYSLPNPSPPSTKSASSGGGRQGGEGKGREEVGLVVGPGRAAPRRTRGRRAKPPSQANASPASQPEEKS